MLQYNFKNRTSEPSGYFLIIYFCLFCKDFSFVFFYLYINTLGRETNSIFMKIFDGDQLVTVLRL